MAEQNLPTASELRQLLRYEPETGLLFWKRRPVTLFAEEWHAERWNKRYADAEAFTAVSLGYRVGRINDKLMKAHRVIWALVEGEWPSAQVDHVNGDRQDNRWGNLRDVSNAENMRNARRYVTNTSGATGVWYSADDKVWRACIVVDGRTKHLGRFALKGAAVEARRLAEVNLGFHSNHGKPNRQRFPRAQVSRAQPQ